MTQLLGGDLMVVDEDVVYSKYGSTGLGARGAFEPFQLSRLSDVVADSLPGTPLTATMRAPYLDMAGHSAGFLHGRLDETGDPMYLPDISIGSRAPAGVSPMGILISARAGGPSRRELLGGNVTLRIGAYVVGPDGGKWDMTAGDVTTFRVTGILGGPWAPEYFMQLADLHRLVGVEDLATYAGLVYRDPFGLDDAAAVLQRRLSQEGLPLQVLTADDFMRITVAEFDHFRTSPQKPVPKSNTARPM